MKTLYLYWGLAFLFAVGCKKTNLPKPSSSNPSDSGRGKAKTVPLSRAAYMSATRTGLVSDPWKATNITVRTVNGIIYIDGISSDNSWISFNFPKSLTDGTWSVTADDALFAYYPIYTNTSNYWLASYSQLGSYGTLTIQTKTNNSLQGTFSFHALQADGTGSYFDFTSGVFFVNF